MKVSKLAAILSLFIAGCAGSANQSVKTNSTDSNLETKLHDTNLGCDSTIVNNEFSFDVLRFEVFKADTTKIKSLFLDKVKLNIEKKKDSERGYLDLYNFEDGTNKLVMYYNDGFYLEEGDINNNKILLNKKISLGMTKADFLKLINAPGIQCDILTVTNDESSFEAIYIFSDAKLKQIKAGQIVE